MPNRTVLSTGLIVSSLMISFHASALIAERIPLATLTGKADLVVTGRVASMATRYEDAPNKGRIVTDVVVTVETIVKGRLQAGETVVLSSPGGEVGDRGQIVPAAPAFARGQRMMVFLGVPRQTTMGPRRLVIGLSQGVFLVTGPECGSTKCLKVRQSIGGVSFIGERPVDPDMPAGDDLDSLLAAVRGVSSRTGGEQ